jgi:hypothetical protein
MAVVRLAAEERMLAAFARYDAVWPNGPQLEVAAARVELCQALLALGEVLPPEVLAQVERDQAAVAAAQAPV